MALISISNNRGDIEEKIEVFDESEWYYIVYSRDGEEKIAYILKDDEKPIEQLLREFLEENNVSLKLKHKLKKQITVSNENKYLVIRGLSFHLTVVVTFAGAAFIGYHLGKIADTAYGNNTLFTTIGIISGMLFAGIASIGMFNKHLRPYL